MKKSVQFICARMETPGRSRSDPKKSVQFPRADLFGVPERSMGGDPEQTKSGNGACAF